MEQAAAPPIGARTRTAEQSSAGKQTGISFSFADLLVLLTGIALLLSMTMLPWLNFSLDLRDSPTQQTGNIITSLPNNTEVAIEGTAFVDRKLWIQVNYNGQIGWVHEDQLGDEIGNCEAIPTYVPDETSGQLVLNEGGVNRLSGDGTGTCLITTNFAGQSITAWQAINITSQSLLFVLAASLIGITAGGFGVLFSWARVNSSLAALVGGLLALWYFNVFFREDWARRSDAVIASLPGPDYTAIGFWIAHILAIVLVLQFVLPRPGLQNGPFVPYNLYVYLRKVWRNMRENPVLYLMILPGVIYFLVFQYGPMYGATIAFKEYRVLEGILGSPWAGFVHFQTIFSSAYFGEILRNTIIISLLKFFVGVPAAVTLAILMNEVRTQWFKRSVQTVTYLPHFLSWVVISGIAIAVLGQADGLVNNAIQDVGGDTVNFLGSPDWFRQVLVATDTWKSAGFEAIIYLAAIAGISPELYEAAAVDGASRLRRIRHITLPGILPVVVLVSLLNIGYVLSAGFEQVFVLYSVPVYSVGDIIDTWVYRRGLEQFQFDVAAAMGLFKGFIGMILILTCNWAAQKFTGSGIW